MRICKSCKVRIENPLPECPLCGARTEDLGGEVNRDYPDPRAGRPPERLRQAVLFAAFAGTLICVLINVLTSLQVLWSVVAGAGIWYLYFSTRFLLRQRKNYGAFTVLQVFLACMLVLAADYALGGEGWSLDYAVPFVIMSGGIALLAVGIVKPTRYREYMIHLLIIAFFGLVPIVLILFQWTHVPWTSAVCVCYSILSVLWMLIFSRRKLKSELKSRLHF